MKYITPIVALTALVIISATAAPAPRRDKTLVIWATPANLTHKAGSALTIDDGQSRFDGIIFAELAPRKWMPGSDGFSRTMKAQANWAQDAEVGFGRFHVQILRANR